MKTVILVRHAKSSLMDPGLKDFDRPLNKRGKRDAPFMGKKLKERRVHPDLILSSPAKRARDTARMVAEAIRLLLQTARVLPLLLREARRPVGGIRPGAGGSAPSPIGIKVFALPKILRPAFRNR